MNYSDLKNKIYLYTNTNVLSFPDDQIVVFINNAYEKVSALVTLSDGRWQWDDTNQTDLPIATTALVSGQQDYGINTAHLVMTRIEIKTAAGDWRKLEPMDQVDIWNGSVTDYLKTPATPQYYDLIGNSIFLYPKPDYSQDASLKVWFKRAPIAFVSGDTTKVPGFNSLFHNLIPLYVAYDFCLSNDLPKISQFRTEIEKVEGALQEYYSLRNKDDKLQLKARQCNRGWSFFR